MVTPSAASPLCVQARPECNGTVPSQSDHLLSGRNQSLSGRERLVTILMGKAALFPLTLLHLWQSTLCIFVSSLSKTIGHSQPSGKWLYPPRSRTGGRSFCFCVREWLVADHLSYWNQQGRLKSNTKPPSMKALESCWDNQDLSRQKSQKGGNWLVRWPDILLSLFAAGNLFNPGHEARGRGSNEGPRQWTATRRQRNKQSLRKPPENGGIKKAGICGGLCFFWRGRTVKLAQGTSHFPL